ncbi:aminotransferase class V-fold PLP-dependent enzyme [Texas Phoenix palm phytoplasma]|uniref:cysteine desulfurase n=1 Tax=Texas Phoenix palm phytoplasma TaxID=176709 RepID=A0ABS5BJ12_9MOLU|nr:aminotransferase class V-fold PLP-dependent enzyme [Texas Phoenix palm phytoplasma]MBP3059534.1 aminotransferase class V-fold PLP-dependent enzyme [Texas Phoenix palm phytoplasma]
MKRNDFRYFFPVFKKNPKLIYLDCASTSLKPKVIIECISSFYKNNGLSLNNSGSLSLNNKFLIEKTRNKIADFINSMPEEIIFTKGTTESLNLLSQILSNIIESGDEIITSELEHNSSLFPWIKIAKEKKANLIFVPLNEENKITINNFKKVFSEKTKIIILTHVSNVLGYETPIEEIIKFVRKKTGKKVLVILDSAQSVGQKKIDVKELDVDFIAFSSHKIYGPFGLGILFGKKYLLNKFGSSQIGGRNIKFINSENNFFYADLPEKFEPGTPNIVDIISFRKSLEFIENISFYEIKKKNKEIIPYLIKNLKTIPNIKIFNENTEHNIILFNFNNIHAHDVESFLSQESIYIRAGNHCSYFTSKILGQNNNTIRVSVGIHNTKQDIDILIKNLKKISRFFSY